MTEIVILSGKGGTGKTSLSASFAYLAGRCVIADCDVDAPNLHLIASPEIREQGVFMSGKVARILPERCTACGTCADLCRFGAIREASDGILAFQVEPLDCEGCGVCHYFCPEQAVELDESVAGQWFVSETRFGPMVHAILAARGENSGKLVALIREKARAVAAAHAVDLILIDGPPGIGCPVIASLANSSFVIVVTEPTLSGKHDLERVFELIVHFQIKAAVCINRYDINLDISSKIERWCQLKGMPLLGKIPYDRAFIKAVSRGKCISEFVSGKTAGEVRALWKRLTQAAGLPLNGSIGRNHVTEEPLKRST